MKKRIWSSSMVHIYIYIVHHIYIYVYIYMVHLCSSYIAYHVICTLVQIIYPQVLIRWGFPKQGTCQSDGLGTDYCSSWAHELPEVWFRTMDCSRRRRHTLNFTFFFVLEMTPTTTYVYLVFYMCFENDPNNNSLLH